MSKLTRYIVPTAMAVLVLSTAACAKSDGASRQALGAAGADTADMQARSAATQLPLPAIAALDAGNAAYRMKQMDQAIAHYREASALAPNHVAPWYGVYMAANQIRNTSLADSAMVHIKALSPDSASYPARVDTASLTAIPSLPGGHPPTQTLPPGHPTSTPPPLP